ncbi:MAG: hypothetical protein O7C58_09080, partial [Rickettsia endosymbiont of Ixodes persulcatus]|nr:hypothetical protein [Rickettsia endosymbiont of Ixodes persulcatus]
MFPTRGSDGTMGGPGENAVIPSNGDNGQNIEITLFENSNIGGIMVYNNLDYSSSNFVLTKKSNDASNHVTLISRGGDGCAGKTGGAPGRSGKGGKGCDATRLHFGTDGGNGADSAGPGLGTNGSDGGNGGNVTVNVSSIYSHLLSLVHINNNGGTGGQPGSHGRQNSGGKGGKGGASFHWTSCYTDYVSHTTTDSNGNTRTHGVPITRTSHECNHGGNDGKDGKPSWVVLTHPLYRGKNGNKGCITYSVDSVLYSQIYKPVVYDFTINSTIKDFSHPTIKDFNHHTIKDFSHPT